jgi:hypothetical protein
MTRLNKLTIFDLKPFHLFLITLVLVVINLLSRWPGELTPDSMVQFNQAVSGQFTDGHPPIMSYLWSLFLPFSEGGISMFLLQVFFHWFGLGLFAFILLGHGHKLGALAMLLSGLTPIAMKYTGVILKDTLLVSFFLTAFALASCKKIQLKFAGVFLGLVAVLTRANAVFAFPSLLFLLIRKKLSMFKSLIFILVVSLPLIPLSQWINHHVLEAKRDGMVKSLQLFDLTGIAYFSGETSVLPVPIANLEGCYTPLYWDTLGKERCNFAAHEVTEDLTWDWIATILTHPVSYLQHRLSHFNYEIFFLVPPIQQCVEAPEGHDCPRSLISDLVAKNGLLWPVTWLVLGLVLIGSGLSEIPRAMVLSGLAYGFAYLFFGVASDFRYFYWTEMAIQTALILQVATTGFARWKAAVGAVSIVLLAGYMWRLASLI